MRQEKLILAYAGENRRLLSYAKRWAKATGAHVHVAHVLEWAPYSFLSPEELDVRRSRRQEEVKRAEAAILAPVLKQLREAGVEAEGEIQYGSVIDQLLEITHEQNGTQILLGRSTQTSMSARVFGTVSISLMQVSPVPVTIVP